MGDSRRPLGIINQLKEVQEENIWIGTNFDKKLNLINEDEAFIRPIPDLHSVAEIISLSQFGEKRLC